MVAGEVQHGPAAPGMTSGAFQPDKRRQQQDARAVPQDAGEHGPGTQHGRRRHSRAGGGHARARPADERPQHVVEHRVESNAEVPGAALNPGTDCPASGDVGSAVLTILTSIAAVARVKERASASDQQKLMDLVETEVDAARADRP